MDRRNSNSDIQTNNTRRSISVHRNLLRAWAKQSHDYQQNHRGYKRNRHYKYIPAIIALFFVTPSYAETVGGVSATAAPVANSSGSVTNQAIQVLQGPYITNTYGGGIQCQGPTLNITPFVTGSASGQKPFEDYYDTPVYDMRDLDDDGAPDNPGSILWMQPTRTGQKDSYNLSVGVSATWSIPQDKKLQDQCKKAAATQIALQQQLTANKRLDFEIARLKNCGNLLKEGIRFHPKSPYYSICADVVVDNVNHIKPHAHIIPSPSVSESRVSESAADLGGPLQRQ
ncbi:hypothetical protein [Synechococcus phage S-8S55]|nr:hypothetical protein [Synechococcus phage S-8S55]